MTSRRPSVPYRHATRDAQGNRFCCWCGTGIQAPAPLDRDDPAEAASVRLGVGREPGAASRGHVRGQKEASSQENRQMEAKLSRLVVGVGFRRGAKPVGPGSGAGRGAGAGCARSGGDAAAAKTGPMECGQATGGAKFGARVSIAVLGALSGLAGALLLCGGGA